MSSRVDQAAAEIRSCADRLGRVPTQKDFDNDPHTKLKARTLAGYFPGGWREALSAAGLKAGHSDQEMLDGLRALALRLGRLPTSRDINSDPELPSAALYLRRFGSLGAARQQAGVADLDRSAADFMIKCGLELSRSLGHLPTWRDWEEACASDPDLPSQWQVYRRFGGGDGAWRMFHYCLLEAGAEQ